MKKIYLFFGRIAKFYVLLTFLMLFCSSIASAQTFTIFSPSAVPDDDDENDAGGPTGIITGVRFKVTQGGTLSEIRFYQGVENSDWTYIGRIWDLEIGDAVNPDPVGDPVVPVNIASGTLFVAGTDPAGWKTIDIPDTHIVPGRIYVAAVFSPGGNYVLSTSPTNTPPNTFADVEETVPPFIKIGYATGSNIDPVNNSGNGAWIYTDDDDIAPVYPENSALFNPGANYFVDVTFTTDFPLPVTLTNLKATVNSKDVTVSWSTSYESNNKGFQVERSNNNSDWYPVTFVAGAGESNSTRNYSYIDRSLSPGLYYYRINQQDFDGKSKLSTTVTATISGKGQMALNAPSPFVGTDAIRFDLPTAQKVKLSLFDMTGREVKILTNQVSAAGSHRIYINSSDLGRQVYIIRLQTEAGILTKKMLVQ